MKKIWFIDVDGKLIGPFTVFQLRNFPGLTPDTLVWREGFRYSLPIRSIPELRDLFEDSEPLNPDEEEGESEPTRVKFSKGPTADEMALDLRAAPPSWIIPILLALLFILLAFYFMNN